MQKPVWMVLVVFIVKLSILSTSLSLEQECGETFVQSNGTISSLTRLPSNKTSNIHCTWNIDTRNNTALHHLELRVVELHAEGFMPDCAAGSYLEIFIGCEQKSIGRFCGVSVLPVLYATDGCMVIQLHSRSSRDKLLAVYSLRPQDKEVQYIPSGCGLSQHDNSRYGNIFSPRWPLPYPDYVDCVWTVRARKNLQVKLIFFDLDVQFYKPCKLIDFIEVRAGSTGYAHAQTLTKTEECEQKAPFSMIIKADTFYITFRSDRSRGPRGFMAGFVAYEKEQEKFDPQVLIIFGSAVLLATIIALKKLVIPGLVRVHRRVSTHGLRTMWPKTPCHCHINCACLKKRSTSRRMSLEKIEDCQDLDDDNPPVIHKDCFMEEKNWGQDIIENTFVPLPDPMSPTTTTKSVTDLRYSYGERPGSDDRRASCKSVRFANSKLKIQHFST